MESLYSELFEAAGAGRQLGERTAGLAGQTQSRWQTLWTMDAASLTVPQVARRLGVSRQHILRLTNDMVAEGLVELVPNPDHQTSPLVHLTADGRATLQAINDAARSNNEAVEREFSAENIGQLRILLRRFTEVVKASADAVPDPPGR